MMNPTVIRATIALLVVVASFPLISIQVSSSQPTSVRHEEGPGFLKQPTLQKILFESGEGGKEGVLENAEAFYSKSFRTEDPKEKISLLRKAINLNPKHRRAREILGRILLSEGQIENAFGEYREHMLTIPYSGRQGGFHFLGFAGKLEQAGRLDLALEIYRLILKVISKESRFERCYLFRGKVDLDRYAEFKDFVTDVQKLLPYCTNQEHRNQAVRLKREGKIDEAIKELHLQLQVNPYPVDTYFMLERLYRNQGRKDKADAVMHQYFEMEKDPGKKCHFYKVLGDRKRGQLLMEAFKKYERECQAYEQ